MNERNISSYIRDIVREETTFLRHYIGKIVNNQDPKNRGAVQILVYDLGFIDESGAIWANPRQGNSMSIPAVDTWAEVYFINGDMTRPIYLYPCTEVSGGDPTQNIPGSFDGTDVKTHIIFESPDATTDNIKYKVVDGSLTFLEGAEDCVLGNKLQTYLDNLVSTISGNNTTFATHTHVVSSAPGTSAPPIVSMTNPSNATDIRSTKIKVK